MGSCFYLRNEPNKYEWKVRAQNVPENMSNAVVIYGKAIGYGQMFVYSVNKVDLNTQAMDAPVANAFYTIPFGHRILKNKLKPVI
jgi:hypothetical protein